DCACVSLRGGDGDAVVEPGEAAEWPARSIPFAGARVVDSDPKLGGAGGELEVARKDADDGVSVVVECDGLTGHVGAPPKVALPSKVGQHDCARRGGRVVGGREETPKDGGDAESLK